MRYFMMRYVDREIYGAAITSLLMAALWALIIVMTMAPSSGETKSLTGQDYLAWLSPALTTAGFAGASLKARQKGFTGWAIASGAIALCIIPITWMVIF